MQLRLLGAVELHTNERVIDVGPAKRRAVLAALAVDAGRPVPIDVLASRVWDDDTAPARPHSVIYAHVSRLRAVLAADPGMRIVRRPGGYLFEAPTDAIDLHRFLRLTKAAEARERTDAERAELLRQAIDLGRGTPLVGLDSGWAARLRDWIIRQRIDAAVGWAEAELHRGHPEAVVGELHALAVQYPFAEHLIAALMLALHATGRDAQALEEYAATCRQLADELGVDPGPRLRHAHHRVLHPIDEPVPAPAQLPLDVPAFVGRADELAKLDALLPDLGRRAGPVVIAAVSGMAGVGKTTMAVHWAHTVAHYFDGQLYIDLHGYAEGGRAVEPADAMRTFLAALGVAPERVPGDIAAQAALLRSTLAGRRMLILLDNASDAVQVRPLLPGTPGCMALITSRDRLTELVVSEGAHPVALPLLSVAEARRLLELRLGQNRIAAETHAANDIVVHCAQLPIALAIVAGRAALHPRFALAAIAAELDGSGDDLDALLDDSGVDLRVVFSWSYDRLRPAAARLFRLLGLHPPAEFSLRAAASLAGIDRAKAKRTLDELCSASLITEPAPGRYAMHNLLRSYAAGLAAEAERDSAVDRLLNHYLRTAHAASQVINPHRDPIPLPASPPDITPEPPVNFHGAMQWFVAQWPTLRALCELAVATGRDAFTGPIAWATLAYFDRTSLWHRQATLQQLALISAERLDDLRQQLEARRGIAAAHGWLGEYDLAAKHFFDSLRLAETIGDDLMIGHVLYGIAWLYGEQERSTEALEYARRAREQFRSAGYPSWELRSRNVMAWQLTQLGEVEQAIRHCESAVQQQLASGDRYFAAETWDTLGFAQHTAGRFHDAIDSYRQSLRLCAEFADRFHEAHTLIHLGDALAAAGERDAFRESWSRAAEIFDDLGRQDAAIIREKLRDLAD